VKVVLDTNVVMSGIFFGGIPGEILEAWRAQRFALALSPPIVDEYWRVGRELEARYGPLGIAAILGVFLKSSAVIEAGDVGQGATTDPDDDKFLSCAAATAASVVVSGDDDLLSVGAWRGIVILSPREFRDRHLLPPESDEGSSPGFR